MHTSAETPTLEKAALTIAEFSTSLNISRTLIPVATALRWLQEQVTRL